MGGNNSETSAPSQEHQASLGESLKAARERRGLTRETVVQETHIPAHYLRMLESDDYQLISDELYLLPFLRKYATFLEMDQEEAAMRLVREVQRIDNAPPPPRSEESLEDVRPSRWRNWGKYAMFGGLFAVIIGAYIAQSRHNDAAEVPAVAPPELAASPGSLPSAEPARAKPAPAGADAPAPSDPSNSASHANGQNDAAATSRALAEPSISVPIAAPPNSHLASARSQDPRHARLQSSH